MTLVVCRASRGSMVVCQATIAWTLIGLFSLPAISQEMTGSVRKISAHMGEMVVEMAEPVDNVDDDGLQFEPMDMLQDLFRPDVVFLMRHGPTDWTKLDIKNVAPTDCTNQRLLSERGKADMRTLGFLMTANGLRPSLIARSEWCRGQQTVDEFLAGAAKADMAYASTVPIEVDPSLDLLLALQGAPNVTELRERISAWDGVGKAGPLLIVTHFTNIEELTQFTIFEGEMLVIDPKRENRVLGYVRLRSAGPDVGHFGGYEARGQ